MEEGTVLKRTVGKWKRWSCTGLVEVLVVTLGKLLDEMQEPKVSHQGEEQNRATRQA